MTGSSPDCLKCERLITLIQRAMTTKDGPFVHRIAMHFDKGEDLLEFVCLALVAEGNGGIDLVPARQHFEVERIEREREARRISREIGEPT